MRYLFLISVSGKWVKLSNTWIIFDNEKTPFICITFVWNYHKKILNWLPIKLIDTFGCVGQASGLIQVNRGFFLILTKITL